MEQTRRSLYRSLLGETYDRLPPVLRAFHDATAAEANGTVRVTRGQGLACGLCATLFRLPGAGQAVPLRLVVRRDGEGECWTRWFGRHRLRTRQWGRQGLLVEAAGPLRFGLRLTASPQGLHFTVNRVWLGTVSLPSWATLRVEAEAEAGPEDDGWRVDVRISAPLLGLLARYEGGIVPC